MANTRGMSATTDQATQDMVIDMASDVLLLEPDKNQLVKFVSKLGKASAAQTTFNWQDDQMVQFADTLGALIVDGTTTTVTVSNRDRWLQNDLILIPATGEILKVTAAAGAGVGTITVARGAGGTAAAAANGAPITKIGSSWGEGSSVRDANNAILSLETQKNPNFNYLQVEKTVVSQTNTEIAVGQAGGMYSGDPRKYQQALNGMVHAKKMNYTSYFGKRALIGNDRKTGGFIEFITRTAATTTLTQANIDTDIATFFRYGNYRKTLFTTRRVAARISQNASAGAFRVLEANKEFGSMDSGTTFGTSVRHYVADSGEFDIVVDDSLTDQPAFQGYGLFVDSQDVKYRFLPGRDTKLLVDVQLADVDGKADVWLTEYGIQRGLANRHGMWTSVA